MLLSYALFCMRMGGKAMNLNQLYYFKTLAELEHYTKAAEKLNISQPTLSHSISSMEKELGQICLKSRAEMLF